MSTYAELLLSEEWKSKRSDILSRDKYTCCDCANQTLITKYHTGIVEGRDNFGGSAKLNCYFLQFFDNDGKRHHANIEKNRVNYFGKQIVYFEGGHNGLDKLLGSRKPLLVDSQLDKSYINAIVDLFETEEEKQKILSWLKRSTPDDSCDSMKNEKIEWLFVNNLHVHHKFYQLGRNPWQYENDALLTLCADCHQNLHHAQEVPVLDELGRTINHFTPCSRCNGEGILLEYDYFHFGICFRCNGARYDELI